MQSPTTEAAVPATNAALSHRPPVPRWLLLAVLLSLLIAGAWFLLGTPYGRTIREKPQLARDDVKAWVHEHRIIAPIVFLLAYVIATAACLPVWWLQVLSGFGFGVTGGVLWSLVGSTLGAIVAWVMARWLAADWFHQRVESRMGRLQSLNQKLDRNGLLVVIIIRLMHGMPFGLSNYAFGVIGIPLLDVAAGTLLGSIPAHTLIVTLGTHPKRVMSIEFVTIQVAMHLALLIPIALWYRRRLPPQPNSAAVPPHVP